MNKSFSALLAHINTKYGQRGFAVDVGAHHGEFSKFLIQTGLFSTVVAFEPNSESYLAIQKGIDSGAGCAFEVINSGLSDESGISNLYCDEDTATASLLQYVPNYNSNGSIRKSPVSVLTLDEYVEANPGLGKLQFLKIDTQGNDLAVIKGGGRVISKHRPIIQAEFIYIPLYEDQCSPSELIGALSELDYIMYSLNNLHVNSEGRLCFCDAIFIPKELDIPITQIFHCIDDEISFQNQIQTLTDVCAERLAVINVLDAEVQRLRNIDSKVSRMDSIFSRLKSWVQ